MNNNHKSSKVVVITGASSGIGRAIALELATENTKLVLLARNLESLQYVAVECLLLGGTPDIFSVDVADSKRLEEIAGEVYKKYGHIDVWVNNAGVGAIGSFTKVPLQDHERVLQTNLHGYLNGSYIALNIFERQGFGTLINNASISSYLYVPHAVSYNASKHAIKALTKSLQQDIKLDEHEHIHVCLVNPEIVDTPAFDHAANYSGAPVAIGMPLVSSGEVAKRIVKLIETPKDEIFVGKLSVLGAWGQRLFPSLTSAILRWGARRYYRNAAPSTQTTTGTLYQPKAETPHSDGGWKADTRKHL